MTKQQFISISDVFYKWATPVLFGLLAWNADRIVAKLDKLEERFNTVQIVQERHETKIITLEAILNRRGER